MKEFTEAKSGGVVEPAPFRQTWIIAKLVDRGEVCVPVFLEHRRLRGGLIVIPL